VDLYLIGVLAGWLAGWWLGWRAPGLPPEPGPAVGPDGSPDGGPRVSVIIPARDEAHRLPALLAGLRAQNRPPDELIVVDDDSTDATASLASAAGAVVVHSGGPPPGWAGKPWACWQGARAATGEVLVFLDADTEPAPTFLARLLALHERRGGLVSVQPYHRMVRRTERLAAVFNVVSFVGVGAGIPWRRRKIVGANGACLACHTDEYHRCGGHEAVRSAVVEDLALAEHFTDAGLPVTVLAGRDALAYRMYPEGLGRLIEGFGKNLASGANALPPTRMFLVVAWITALLAAGGEGVQAVLGSVTGNGWPGWSAVAVYGAFAAQLGVLLHRLGNFGVTPALLHPVPAWFFVLVFSWSLVLAARGEVRWKGRSVPIRTRRSS